MVKEFDIKFEKLSFQADFYLDDYDTLLDEERVCRKQEKEFDPSVSDITKSMIWYHF